MKCGLISSRGSSRECRRVVQLAIGITSGNRACRTCRRRSSREDVRFGVGVGVVEFQLYERTTGRVYHRVSRPFAMELTQVSISADADGTRASMPNAQSAVAQNWTPSVISNRQSSLTVCRSHVPRRRQVALYTIDRPLSLFIALARRSECHGQIL